MIVALSFNFKKSTEARAIFSVRLNPIKSDVIVTKCGDFKFSLSCAYY